MSVSQSVGLLFCHLPVFPSCLPIFGSVPVLISVCVCVCVCVHFRSVTIVCAQHRY